MTERNLRIARALIEAWNRADLEGFLSRFADDVEVIFPPEVPEPGPYHGREALASWAREFRDAWEQVTVKPQRVIARGAHVLVTTEQRSRGAATGIEMVEHDAHLFTFAGDEIVRWRNFSDPEAAERELDRAGDPDDL